MTSSAEPRGNDEGTGVLIAVALAFLILHVAVGGRYGFHRDELATLEDARHMAAGFVAYPPVTPFFGHLSLSLFGVSVRGFRFFAAVAQAVVVLLAGLMARELGGKHLAQVVAAVAVGVAPVSMAAGALMQYVAFDYLWWVLTAYLLIRLLRTGDERLWVAIGAVIGVGMMTKYTMIFLVAGIVAGLLFTDARRYMSSRWLWLGVAVSLLVFAPNLVWQIRHHFVSLDFLQHIHARDVRIGRTKDFLPDQLKVAANPFTIPLWIAGLFFYFRSPGGKRYRLLGWMFVVPLALFVIAKGRGYYMAPAYPMLLAAGAVVEERWVRSLPLTAARAVRVGTFAVLAVSGVIVAAITLPIAPVNSRVWNFAIKVDSDFVEEIGWPELVAEVARVRDRFPADNRGQVGILAANYGEAGAINLYGPTYGLPRVISGINSFWAYGYGDPPPQALIVVGVAKQYRDENFQGCEVAGHVSNPYGVQNEEMEHPEIYVCRGLKRSWPEFWKDWRYYG